MEFVLLGKISGVAFGAALVVAGLVSPLWAAGPAFSGLASWYGPGFQGRRTASGEHFNTHAMTAAHKSLPLGTRVLVRHGGRAVVVRINDRGPYVRGRIIDLSHAAKLALGMGGLGRVSLTVLGR